MELPQKYKGGFKSKIIIVFVKVFSEWDKLQLVQAQTDVDISFWASNSEDLHGSIEMRYLNSVILLVAPLRPCCLNQLRRTLSSIPLNWNWSHLFKMVKPQLMTLCNQVTFFLWPGYIYASVVSIDLCKIQDATHNQINQGCLNFSVFEYQRKTI